MKKLSVSLMAFLLLSLVVSGQEATGNQRAERLRSYLSETYPASVTKVCVSASKVRVKGRLPGGKDYYLAEVTPWEDLDAEGLGDELVPLKHRRFCKSLTRRVERDGIVYDRSLSRWAVVTLDEGGNPVLYSHARYADRIKQVRKAPKMELTGKKGLGGFSMNKFSSDLDSMDIRSVTVNIHLNSLLYASERPGTFAREYGGRTYWFDSAKVARTDKVLEYCTSRGIITSAITLVGLNSADPELTPVFRHPDCDGGFYTMPNMTTVEGFNAYAAVLDFLADRYSSGEHGRINNWIIHNEVDYGIGWTNMGKQPYEAYMDAYEKSMRLNYNIATRYDPNTWVLGSYTHNYTVGEDENGFPVRSMLEDHVRYSDAEGDFRWGVAQHPYPQDLNNPRLWADDTQSIYSTETKYLTFKNLEVIDEWIRRPEHFYKGKTKRLLFLSENGTNSPSYSEKDLADQAAGACWAWKKIEALPGIDAAQWHAWIDNRGEFGLRIGLRRYPDDETEPGGIKPAWEVWKAVGTDREDEVFAPYLKVMGLNDWSEIFHPVTTFTTPEPTEGKVNIIFETDMGNDTDDALALDYLYKMLESGKVNFLATCLNKEGTAPAAFVDIMNTWYGHPDIPIGIVRNGAYCEQDAVNYAKAVVMMTDADGNPAFARTVADPENLPDAHVLYRKLLSQAEDNSVVIASVGFSTNLQRLMETGPDEYSDLSGMDLVAKKVKLLVTMAGNFENTAAPEYNVMKDVPAARAVFEEWPTEVVTSPFEVGLKILYPATSIENDFGWAGLHPMVEAYKAYLPMPYDRMTWDPTAVLYAVEGGPWFNISSPGRIKVSDRGTVEFIPDPEGNRRYLSVTPEQVEAVRNHFIEVITTRPANKR